MAGETASFDFTGTWVNIGFVGDTSSGGVEIFIDGVSQGQHDLYRNQSQVHRICVPAGLAATNHTISVTTLAPLNAYATNDRVYLDFIDTWDGTILLGGTFEQNDTTFIYGGTWGNRNDGDASGGSYHRSSCRWQRVVPVPRHKHHVAGVCDEQRGFGRSLS